MPNTAQAKKRLRQDAVLNLRNRQAKSEIKTLTKRVLAAVEEGKADEAQTILREAQARLDKAAKRGILHAKTVDRRKALLFRRVATIKN